MLRRAVSARREVADESAVSRAIHPRYMCSCSSWVRDVRAYLAPPIRSGADVRVTMMRGWRPRYGHCGCVRSWWCPVPERMLDGSARGAPCLRLINLTPARTVRAIAGSG